MILYGLDPALGGGNSVTVADARQDKLYVIDSRIDYGLSKTEQQIEILSQITGRYGGGALIVEFDAQQKGLGNDDRLRALAIMRGVEIVPHYTRGEKLDTIFGVASMNQSFAKREISIPWGDEEARRTMEPLCHQLRAWRPDVPTKKLRQDAVMSLWFCWRYWQKIRKVHTTPIEPAWRPGWVGKMQVA